MGSTLFLLFNHRFTPSQEGDARASLEVERIIALPPELQELWSNIPPGLPAIGEYLEPIRRWLASQSHKDDFVLIQGDFGACYLMVGFAREHGLIPIYSTTAREAEEEHRSDGSVKLTHRFRHICFREYGA